MKILAIDFGDKKIGLAISDELGMVCTKLPVLFIQKERDKLDGTIFVIKDNRPERIVVGLPTGNDGGETKQTKIVRQFITDLLERIKSELSEMEIDVVTWDESFSSKNAEEGRSKKFKREKSDSEAARLVLQEYLDSPDGFLKK